MFWHIHIRPTEHLFALKQALELYRFFGSKISELDSTLEVHLNSFEDHSEGKWLPKLKPPKAALARSNCALGAFFRRIRSRLGSPKAITATAHKLAKIVYGMLKYGKEYVDAGKDYYEQQDRARKNLEKRAAALNFRLVPNGDAA